MSKKFPSVFEVVSFIYHGAMRNRLICKAQRSLKAHRERFISLAQEERGDVPGWVLVVLMTTGLVTGIWTVAQPRLSSILRNSLDNMNSIR